MTDFMILEDAIEIVMTMARITSKTKEQTIACDVVEDFFVNNMSDEYKFTFPIRHYEELIMYIMLEGNLTEGFKAYGPYDDWADASDFHSHCEGWIMEIHPAKESSHDKIILVGQHDT